MGEEERKEGWREGRGSPPLPFQIPGSATTQLQKMSYSTCRPAVDTVVSSIDDCGDIYMSAMMAALFVMVQHSCSAGVRTSCLTCWTRTDYCRQPVDNTSTPCPCSFRVSRHSTALLTPSYTWSSVPPR